ncbi:acyl-CoA dehydrogenase/oxidase C-terminal [Mycena belliarum]|uniref:Acyl-CoA dehydrogenase/oxidase C-terminal n=1 Tax=Mycena belliarum TaxID=1033014 RepID=A0AAD6XX08_9AGAR|nr:acyl-CoA dehydrogenase/oxidase C-terminal [Mycena belliae]
MRAIREGFEALARGLSSGDTSHLAEMHVMTSGLKVLVSTTAIQDLETVRRSMGGGTGAARLPVWGGYQRRYEGENFVLDQQVLRAALKTFRALIRLVADQPSLFSTTPPRAAASLSPSSYYLRLLLDKQLVRPELGPDSWTHPATAILLLEWCAALLLHEATQTLAAPEGTATQRISRAVTEVFVAARVGEMIGGLSKTLKQREAALVEKVYILYLLTTIESALVDLLSFGLFRAMPTSDPPRSRDPTRALRLAIATLCGELLPQAVGLSDAFGFSDWELDSALGVYDGNVYETLWARAQEEPLNQTEVTEAYEASIRPMLLRGQSMAATKPKL